MASVAARVAGWREAWRVYRDPRVIAILALGFSSGLPIMLVATTLSTWLAEVGTSKSAIGLFAYVFAPYTFKFAWAPLVDRLPLPPLTTLLGRRRGWILAAQIGLIASIFALGRTDPATGLAATAVCALLVAFCSATQDIAIDAYRIEILPREELGAGAGVVVLGYRIGMWVATAGALLVADAFGWSTAYTAMALLVLVGVGTVLLVREPAEEGPGVAAAGPGDPDRLGRERAVRGDRGTALGLVPLLVVGWLLLVEPLSWLFTLLYDLGPRSRLWTPVAILDGAVVALGIATALALLRRVEDAPRLLRNWALVAMAWSVLAVLAHLLAEAPLVLAKPYAWLFLGALFLLADGTALLLGGTGFDPAAFTAPIWLLVAGFWIRFLVAVWAYGVPYFSRSFVAVFGLTPVERESRLHLWVRRAVVEPFYDFFARHGVAAAVLVLALISVFKASDVLLTLMANPFYIEMGFTKAQIAWVSKTFGLWMTLLGGLVGGAVVYRLGLIRSMALAVVVMAASNLAFLLLARAHALGAAALGLDEAGFGTLMLALFHLVILIENLSGGLGTAVFVAYLSSLCNVHYTAVQYALLTSFMQLFGKFVIVPSSGFFVDALGWEAFFAGSALAALPALALLYVLARLGLSVEPPPAPAARSTASSARSPSR